MIAFPNLGRTQQRKYGHSQRREKKNEHLLRELKIHKDTAAALTVRPVPQTGNNVFVLGPVNLQLGSDHQTKEAERKHEREHTGERGNVAVPEATRVAATS